VALGSEGTWFNTLRGSGESTVADSSKNPSSCPKFPALATAPSSYILQLKNNFGLSWENNKNKSLVSISVNK
jgi:hypothetical protein